MLRRFVLHTSGNFGIMSALMLPVLIGSAGLAIDYTQLSRAKTELQLITDAAVLAAANRTVSPADRKKIFDEMLQSADTQMAFSIVDSDVDIDEKLTSITIRGETRAKVQVHFLGRTGHDIVTAVAEAMQSTKKVELGLVLDNTGSMGQAGIDALKRASLSLVNAIEGNSTAAEDVKIGLVPFVTAVNIKGEGFDGTWIDSDGKGLYNGWSFLDESLRNERVARNSDR
jgi:Flp pilus assembly protein TadG